MSDDLMKRLREVGGISDDGATRWYINPDGPEAAAALERMRDDSTALRARLAEVDGALEAADSMADSYDRGLLERWEVKLYRRRRAALASAGR